jgi:hypothetical protein
MDDLMARILAEADADTLPPMTKAQRKQLRQQVRAGRARERARGLTNAEIDAQLDVDYQD